LSDDLEDRIQRVIENNFDGVPSPTGKDVGRSIIEDNAQDDYVEFAKSTIDIDLSGLKVALDCANGAAYQTAVKTFRELGADVRVINNDPDGVNINDNCGSTHPEELMDYVVRKKCDVGFAFDGDADRCLAVDEKGNLVNGDFIMGICGKYLKSQGRLKNNKVVVTVMSNMGLEIALEKEGISEETTKVGDRYVLEEMKKGGYVLGGEQSGHIIFLEFNTTGDGLVTALQVSSIIKKSGETVSKLASIMRELPQILVNVTVSSDKINLYKEDSEVISAIKSIEDKLSGKGRVLIRPSGTEPLLRIMLEGENQDEIDILANSLASLIKEKCK
ncbi:MAG: phosphoglucosamine mutase, partial [Bacillota bacterium]|nr:phosphoglucosamine mutase [Bacillota bacterium]